MKTVLALVLFTAFAVAQPADTFAKAYLAGGGGINDTSQNYMWAAYAKRTGLFNGSTNFPTFSYSECRAYRFPFGKNATAGSTDCSTGLLFPFYERDFFSGKVHVRLAVDGNVGVSATSTGNVGYTVGSKVVADVSRSASSKWGIVTSVSPSRSSVAGVSPHPLAFGVRLAFNGF